MFEDPMQWIVIGIVVIALLMWGPSKIPQLAASLGKARKEFDTARKEIENPMNALLQSATQTPTGQQPQPVTAQVPSVLAPTTQPELSGDDVLIRTARQMGIATEGKTREQLSLEMVSRASVAAPGSSAAKTQ
jgi:sec-independent protein translocase protein TatA